MFSSLIVSILLLLFFPAHLSLLPLSLSVSACVFVLCWLVFLLVSRCYSLWAVSVSFSVYCMCLSLSLLLFLCPSCLSTSFYNFSVCRYPSFISVLLSVYLFSVYVSLIGCWCRLVVFLLGSDFIFLSFFFLRTSLIPSLPLPCFCLFTHSIHLYSVIVLPLCVCLSGCAWVS